MTGLLLLVAGGIVRMDAPHLGLLWLLAWLCAASVAEGTIVLCAVLGSSLGQLLALLLFVYAGLAAAGGTVPLQALPGVLRWLAGIEPLRQILAGTQAILYFDAQADAGLARAVTAATLGLVIWLIAGAVVVKWYDRKGLQPPGSRTPGVCGRARCSSTDPRMPRPGNRTPGTQDGRQDQCPGTGHRTPGTQAGEPNRARPGRTR